MTRPSLREKVIINKSNSTWLFPASRTGVIFFFMAFFQVSAVKRKGAWHAIRARLALACTRLKNTHTKEQKSKTKKFSCCTGVVFPNMQKDSNVGLPFWKILCYPCYIYKVMGSCIYSFKIPPSVEITEITRLNFKILKCMEKRRQVVLNLSLRSHSFLYQNRKINWESIGNLNRVEIKIKSYIVYSFSSLNLPLIFKVCPERYLNWFVID